MAEVSAESWRGRFPPLVVFGVAAIAIAVIVWAVRAARRSPRRGPPRTPSARQAGVALVRLDDAVDELDLEVGLSGALYGGGAPASLRRARLTAQHVRDAAFEEYRAISDPATSPDEIRRVSARIERRSDRRARDDRARPVPSTPPGCRRTSRRRRRSPPRASASRRCARSMGDPGGARRRALVALRRGGVARMPRAPRRLRSPSADEAERLLDARRRPAADPTRTRARRPREGRARAASRRGRRAHARGDASARDAGRAGGARRVRRGAHRAAPGRRRPASSSSPPTRARLGGELRAIEARADALETDAARRPTRTIDRIARLRDRLDLALGDARTAQQRLRGARTALPGTLAAARDAIAQAEASVAHARAGADARSRLVSAQRELAAARQAPDPVAALDAARRAMRDAEDAKALADYDGSPDTESRGVAAIVNAMTDVRPGRAIPCCASSRGFPRRCRWSR